MSDFTLVKLNGVIDHCYWFFQPSNVDRLSELWGFSTHSAYNRGEKLSSLLNKAWFYPVQIYVGLVYPLYVQSFSIKPVCHKIVTYNEDPSKVLAKKRE